MKPIYDIVDYTNIVDYYNRKNSLSNVYIHEEVATIIRQNSLFVDLYKNNVFFFVKINKGMRIYYYINDLNENASFNGYEDLVIEILYRGEFPLDEVNFFLKNGFKKNLVREQYGGIYRNLKIENNLDLNFKIEYANSIKDIEQACSLFNSVFDALSGDFISEDVYQELLESKSILVAKSIDGQSFLGALHQRKNGIINILGHIAVIKEAQGKGIGNALVDKFIELNHKDEKTRYLLWVQKQNDIAINMYENKGFKFLNKSTISLIK